MGFDVQLCLTAVQTVGQLFSVPHSKKRKKYLESLEAGMDLTAGNSAQVRQQGLHVTALVMPDSQANGAEVYGDWTFNTQYPASADVQRNAALGKRRRRQPFPPQHYVATVETLKTSDYTIPEMSASGDIICLAGYAATRPGTRHRC